MPRIRPVSGFLTAVFLGCLAVPALSDAFSEAATIADYPANADAHAPAFSGVALAILSGLVSVTALLRIRLASTRHHGNPQGGLGSMLRFGLLLAMLGTTIVIPAFAQDPPAWEDASCEFDNTDLKLEPEPLLQAFLEKDSRAEFLEFNPWMGQAIVCPGHLSGPDSFTLVSGYQIVSKDVAKDKATFKVRYEVVGGMTSGGESGDQNSFVPATGPREETFVAVRTPAGWKLQEFVWQMALPKPALAQISHRGWVPGDLEKFQKATGVKP